MAAKKMRAGRHFIESDMNGREERAAE